MLEKHKHDTTKDLPHMPPPAPMRSTIVATEIDPKDIDAAVTAKEQAAKDKAELDAKTKADAISAKLLAYNAHADIEAAHQEAHGHATDKARQLELATQAWVARGGGEDPAAIIKQAGRFLMEVKRAGLEDIEHR